MRIIGCIMIIGISMAIGRTLAQGYVERVKNLQLFITAFTILRTKIGFGQEVLEVAFWDIGNSCPGKIGDFFLKLAEEMKAMDLSVSEIWNREIEEYFKLLDFNFEDERILLDFGNSLGKGDMDEEVRNINLVVERLKTQLSQASHEKMKYAKLYRTLGGVGGTALAILLI